MIRIIAGGRKSNGWVLEACREYEKRLRKPFAVVLENYEEEKLARLLERWPFERNKQYIIIADERGENMSSTELAERFQREFVAGREVIIIIGGAYGVSEEARMRADLVWSFSRLVFPHMLMRVMMYEQVYRAQEIANGGKYHHE